MSLLQATKNCNGETVQAIQSTIVGHGNTVTGPQNTVRGNDNTVRGARCKVYGNKNTVEGPQCKVFGDANKVTGPGCKATGERNVVLGPDAREYHVGGDVVNKMKRKGTRSAAISETNVTGLRKMVSGNVGSVSHVGNAHECMFEMHEGTNTHVTNATDVTVVLRDKNGKNPLAVRRLTSSAGFSMTGLTFSCGDVRVKDGILYYCDDRVPLDLFTLPDVDWEELKNLARLLLQEVRFIKGEDRETDDETIECVICKVNERQCVIFPCGHRLLCIGCANDWLSRAGADGRHGKGEETCPTCRATVQEIKRTFS